MHNKSSRDINTIEIIWVFGKKWFSNSVSKPWLNNIGWRFIKSQFPKFVLLESDRKLKEKMVLFGKFWVAHPCCKTYALYLKMILT